MKPSALLRTKFLVPQPLNDRIPRPVLIAWLNRQIDKRLVLLSAPPGYGKTTLLVEFLSSSELPAAWIQLDPADSDPSVFLAYLIESISQIFCLTRPSFGKAAQNLLAGAHVTISHQQILTVLINELSVVCDEPWLLVMEDYHFIASPVVHNLVNMLLDNGPANLHILISTRADPPLALARLRARGLLAELRSVELRFRPDEIANLINLTVPGISLESLDSLVEKTEGWAAALQIVRSSLQGQDISSAESFIAGLSGSHRYIFTYLVQEVFRRQDEARQTFLMHTSVLQQMDAAACDALPGIENAHRMLEQLEGENLFLESLDAQRHWYRYHHLFREFLYSKLRAEQPAQAVVLHMAAGRHYETCSEPEAAFFHYIEARQWEDAARIVQIFASDYLERGRVELLNRYLAELPETVLRGYPMLLLQRGNARRRLGEAGLAINDFEDARSAFASASDQAGISRALTRLAEIHRAQGDYRRAEMLASEALKAAPCGDHTVRADALMALAKCTGFLTGMDRGRLLAEQAVDEMRQAGRDLSQTARANFLQSLGQICWWHGDPQATIAYCRQALELVPDDLSPIAAEAYISLVSPYLYMRDLENATRYAERGLEIAQTLHLTELLPSAYSVLGNALTRSGDQDRAESCLRQSMDLAQVFGLASYERLMTAGYLAYNLAGRGCVEEARQVAEGALWAYTGNPDTYEAYVCRSVLADVALQQGLLGTSEALYAELVEVGERRNFRIPLAMVYFGLAYVYLTTDRQTSGLEYARKALALIEPTQAVQLFLDQGERSRVVCQALQAAGEGSRFLQRVLEVLPAEDQVLLVTSELTGISVRCLGAFRVDIGQEEVSQERWVSTKARDLLAYFITFRGQRICTEKAFDALWTDKPGRSMTAFHTALSRLRRALKRDNLSPQSIHFEGGEYWLDLDCFHIDVDEFEASLAKARSAPAAEASAPWYERAISLYHGEYLDNLYYDWLIPERQRFVQEYISALRALADYHYSQKRFTNALELLQRALRVDNLIEDQHCQAMRLYCALGDRVGLINQYRDLQQVLSSELGLQPLASTIKLYQKLLDELEG